MVAVYVSADSAPFRSNTLKVKGAGPKSRSSGPECCSSNSNTRVDSSPEGISCPAGTSFFEPPEGVHLSFPSDDGGSETIFTFPRMSPASTSVNGKS